MQIDRVLGQRVTYPQSYQPDVLVAVPRQLNREGLGIKPTELPFVGADAWHAYEVSCLTKAGLPVVGLMKIVYPCTSQHIVESKSLKLYLNSFNMERMGSSAAEAMTEMTRTVERDLSKLLSTTVEARTFSCATEATLTPFRDYETLEDMSATEGLTISNYTETPSLLTSAEETYGRIKVKSDLLRSNCRVTHQPDWGTVFIDMEGKRQPDKRGLLSYIVSLRGENHFHEEICELIYTRLKETYAPKRLMVCCVYTRRGGIDICPARASEADMLPRELMDKDTITGKLLRQ